MKRRLLMWILWPAFLCAALAELVVFAVVDPADLRFFGEQIAVSAEAVYTVSFFVFWLLCGLSSALTLYVSPRASSSWRRTRIRWACRNRPRTPWQPPLTNWRAIPMPTVSA